MNKLEDKYHEAAEKKIKVCPSIYYAMLFHLRHCLSISSFMSFILQVSKKVIPSVTVPVVEIDTTDIVRCAFCMRELC